VPIVEGTGPTGPLTEEIDVFSPRTLVIAGVVLIAIALGWSGHGFWWLFALLWLLPHSGRHGSACHGRARDRRRHQALDVTGTPATSEPDPTRDRHEAFPVR
jgi:hypothetical protein